MQTKTGIVVVLLATALGGCGGGGGGGSSAATCLPTMLDPNACNTAAGGVSISAPSLDLSLKDTSGSAFTQVSPDHPGTLRAVVKDSNGAPVPNVAVTFTTTDKTGVFIPPSGTALTDANGVARVGLPAGKQVGGFTATANTTVNSKAVTGTTGYAVAFPTLSLSTLAIAPETLSSGGNASVSITVLSGSTPYAPPLSVSFTSPCSSAGKASIGSPVVTQNGVATASYTDKGCGVEDVITASALIGDGTLTQSGKITVLRADVGSVNFVSAETTNIALKGTGGIGRQETSTLTFQVRDSTGHVVSGKLVDFVFSDSNSATTVGGLTLNPTFATSAADGTVTTLVTAGTIPTSMRVVASVRDTAAPITTLSNVLVISSGVPDQKHFSLSTETGNCEGWDFDLACSTVTATLGDHFGNPVPDGTAVNFTAEGGVIEASCLTGSLPPAGETTPTGQTTNSKIGPGSGTCSVLLRSSDIYPPHELDRNDVAAWNAWMAKAPRVTVLAYAIGEEDFSDTNGNNVCDGCDVDVRTTPVADDAEFKLAHDKGPDISRDDNEDGLWNPGEACVGPNNGTCSTPGDGKYNGVLRRPQTSDPQATARTLYVSSQLVQTFSGSYANVKFNPPKEQGVTCTPGETVDVQVTVKDDRGYIMPAGTNIEFTALFGFDSGRVEPPSRKVPNVVHAVGQELPVPSYIVTVQCKGTGKLIVKVTTPRGIETNDSIAIN